MTEAASLHLGDFNLDLIKHMNTFEVNIQKYLHLNNEFGFQQKISGPTHLGISLLDHLHLNHPEKYGRTGHFQLFTSDHELVFCIKKQAKNNIPAKTALCRNYNNVDWSKINEEILKFDSNNIDGATSHRISSIDNYGPVNHHISVDTKFIIIKYNNQVVNIIGKHAPPKKKLVKGKFAPWMTRGIVDSMKIRNKSHKKPSLLETKKIG
jgi:hypothetical protein